MACLRPFVGVARHNTIALFVVGSGAVSEGDRVDRACVLHHSDEMELSMEL